MKRPTAGGCYVRDPKTGNLKAVRKTKAQTAEETKTETKAEAASKAPDDATKTKEA
ncbi:MAG: hypothetical protein ABGX47_08110 [Martelella sp.]|uniref:hypothetical protein n=1 Tax=Martelella sp. TaxID=1969699 RepID=UPI0032420DEB